MLIAAADDILLQQVLYFAYPIEFFPAYSGKTDSARCMQPLQSAVAYFKESTDFVAVHPAVFGLFSLFAFDSSYKFGNRIDFFR
jgi:hypothetical protein